MHIHHSCEDSVLHECRVTADPSPQPGPTADIPIRATVSGFPQAVTLLYIVNYGQQSVVPMTAGANGELLAEQGGNALATSMLTQDTVYSMYKTTLSF